MLHFENGESFATGSCPYRFGAATEHDPSERIMVPIRIQGVESEAALDTGGLYFICNPALAEKIGFDPEMGMPTNPIRIRGEQLRGSLYRITLELIVTSGEPCEVSVTAFVPDPDRPLMVELPAFLGFLGCMERLRFAIDPTTETLYFGAI